MQQSLCRYLIIYFAQIEKAFDSFGIIFRAVEHSGFQEDSDLTIYLIPVLYIVLRTLRVLY